jgi:hypothetical protein
MLVRMGKQNAEKNWEHRENEVKGEKEIIQTVSPHDAAREQETATDERSGYEQKDG